MRSVSAFRIGGDRLTGVLDHAPAKVGLLIVAGGNEIAAGPQRSMARLAGRVADHGFPVFRFDRRGVGDSDGENRGWDSSAPDIAAAVAAFEHVAGVRRIVAFGNCDAATALAVHPLPPNPANAFDRIGVVARVLGNPWLDDKRVADLPPPAAIRAHYRTRLSDPALWRRLFTGRIDLWKAVRGAVAATDRTPPPLLQRFAAALAAGHPRTSVVLATEDATARAFAAAWRDRRFDRWRAQVPVHRIATAAHGFTGEADLNRLRDILLAELHTEAALLARAQA